VQFYGAGTVNEVIREALHPYPDGLAIVSTVAARFEQLTRYFPSPDRTRAASPAWKRAAADSTGRCGRIGPPSDRSAWSSA
jgi:hypothetical protein